MLAAADSMPAPVTALPLPACGVRGAHLDGGMWVFREGEAPPYNMSRSAWPEIWQRPGNTHYYGLCRELLPATTGEHVWTPRGCRLRGFEESAQAGCRLVMLSPDPLSLRVPHTPTPRSPPGSCGAELSRWWATQRACNSSRFDRAFNSSKLNSTSPKP